MMTHTIAHLEQLAAQSLARAGASSLQAQSTAQALVRAEAQGLASHGLSRVPQYVAHLKNGRVNGQAQPAIRNSAQQNVAKAAVLVDAQCGFAFPACDVAVQEAVSRAQQFGIAIAAVTNSHHFGAAGTHILTAAKQGLVAIAMGNSPAAMPFAGGKRAILGTNPIAAAFARKGGDALLIDLSLSEVARGKIMLAAKQGQAIPLGWAVDAQGEPTTDANAALAGAMLPFGGSKGAMLALMVEIMVSALTGAHFGLEADSFFVDAGNQPKIGQAFIVINPQALAGQDVYFQRLEDLLRAILHDEGVRLPGARRFNLERQALAQGLALPPALYEQLQRLAQQA